jgi:hypothetical protein
VALGEFSHERVRVVIRVLIRSLSGNRPRIAVDLLQALTVQIDLMHITVTKRDELYISDKQKLAFWILGGDVPVHASRAWWPQISPAYNSST